MIGRPITGQPARCESSRVLTIDARAYERLRRLTEFRRVTISALIDQALDHAERQS